MTSQPITTLAYLNMSSISDDWNQLITAHQLIRSGDTDQAFKIYDSVLQRRVEQHFVPGPNTWGIEGDPEHPSMNWACFYLSPYFHIRRGRWPFWLSLAQEVFKHPSYSSMPVECQSVLISTSGWAQVNTSKQLPVIVDEQLDFLEKKYGFLSDFCYALHYHLIGYIYQQMRKPDEAFSYLEQAQALVDASKEPFYALRIQETLASTYYFLNNFNKTYYEKSIQLYTELEQLAETKQQYVEIIRQAYNLGWVYAEIGEEELAWRAFRKGYNTAQHLDLLYEMSLNQYGEGYVLFRQGEMEVALELLSTAARAFYKMHADLLTAMCLQLISAIYQKMGELITAIDYAERGLKSQRRVENPVQTYHILRRLAKLHFKARNWQQLKVYFPEYFALKRSLRK